MKPLETLEPRREAGEAGLECTPLCKDFRCLFLPIGTLLSGETSHRRVLPEQHQ